MILSDDLIDLASIRRRAGAQVYQRGESYYRQGRVKLVRIQPSSATFEVWGTYLYSVTIELQNGVLRGGCSCPYSSGGDTCKHQVAAALMLKDYLLYNGPVTWSSRLSDVLQSAGHRRTVKLRQYYLIFSLQPNYSGELQILPYRLQENRLADMAGTSEPLSTADFERWISENKQLLQVEAEPAHGKLDPQGCLNAGSRTVSLANAVIRQRELESRSAYYYNRSSVDADFLPLLVGVEAPVYLGESYYPFSQRLTVLEAQAQFKLQVEHDEQGVHLKTLLQFPGQTLLLSEQQYQIINSNPIWIAVQGLLFRIEQTWQPDLTMAFLEIPAWNLEPQEEDSFLENQLPRLMEMVALEGQGLEWEDLSAQVTPRLYLAEVNKTIKAELRFAYGEAEIPYDPRLPAEKILRKPGEWKLLRIQRSPVAEEKAYRQLSAVEFGLKRSTPPGWFELRARTHPLDFLLRSIPRLVEVGYEIFGEERIKSVRANRSTPSLRFTVTSGIDWFDIQAVVDFGGVEASLVDIRRAIRQKSAYIKLADGTIGEIPAEWIERYRSLFSLGEISEQGIKVAAQHITLIDSLLADEQNFNADAEFRRRLERLRGFNGVQTQPLPRSFVGELRPYQVAGYEWLHFLHEFKLGGCLADDMGLGKTVQVLVFLQSLRERAQPGAADLIVLPRSLLVNWQREAARFTPRLRLLEYFGGKRTQAVKEFNQFDMILTTYGTMRRDIEKLRKYPFHYVVLDESQAIKNPLAQTSRAARLLQSQHRLVMTGTPVENSTVELWSQFAFLNPGLLGSFEHFKSEFALPIEKKSDAQTAELLRKMVFPFILRRTKNQVATELPPRTERVMICDMEPAQRKLYDRAKQQYRGLLLGMLAENGMDQARMKVLEGLLRLRQISNHPRLVEQDFRGTSAKLELLLETLQTLQAEGHKALVFSQFVQMLKIIRQELDKQRIRYTYLDGQTRDRQARVDEFQGNPAIPIFLISLKAGGVGLNLTAADYVIHVDPWWNPAVELQAADRTHRIGQDKPVFIYKMITRDSVEEKIMQLQEQKRHLVDQLISAEGGFFKSISADDVKILFS